MALTLRGARRAVRQGDLSGDAAFDVLAALAREGAFADRDAARELLIRLLARRDEIPGPLQGLLQSLVREHGLYPYLRDVLELPAADRMAYETHRPDGLLDEDIVFHAEQSLVYERLLAGESVVLSAPTSFGKSLVVDAVLAARDFCNAAVVVPTVALMDECRRRMARLAGKYKIITHGTQALAERNLLVMTQERLLEMQDLPPLDFFVVDEFYKLDPAQSDERSNRLNILFHRLHSTGAQFYLLGPSIAGLTPQTGRRLRATFISTDFTTVATDVERISVPKPDLPDALADVCRETGPGTIVYCQSPARTRLIAGWLLERGVGGGRDLDDAADWIGDAYHPSWIVGRALRAGIGIHHGRLPRALGHHLVRLFNEGRLPYLLVTSTLIEGVNTSARSVVVLDNKIANRKYDYFTFSNIRGRSGRMNRHYVGRVVVFNPEPSPAGLTVDVPALSQDERATDEILLQLPEDELTDRSRDRLAPYLDQRLIDVQTLRSNVGVSPALQLKAAEQLDDDPRRWAAALDWNGAFPTAAQVRDLAEVMFTLTGSSSAARTPAQLGARLNMLRFQKGDVVALAREDIQRRGTPVDDAVEDAFDFARNYAQFKIPSALTTAGTLARDVLPDGSRVADTSVFAGQVENMFLPPFVTVLEEYGLPAPVTLKLAGPLRLDTGGNLDALLARLRALVPGPALRLGAFEDEMLRDTQQAL